MARKSSPPSEEIRELTIAPAVLEQRWPLIVRNLRVLLGLSESDFNIILAAAPATVFTQMIGGACEYIERHRGSRTSVVPFTSIGRQGLKSWLSIREEWEQKTKTLFAFRYVSLTVYIGYAGEILKPQVFRAEWAGVANWNASGLGFQSPKAGHPHWQFDALVSLRDTPANQRDLSLSRLNDENSAVEFSGDFTTDVLADMRRAGFERIHFASAAPWWQKSTSPDCGVHMNAPRPAEALTQWILESVAYIKQELARCTLTP